MGEEDSATGAVAPEDDPQSELNVLRREVRQLQASVRDSAMQIASQQDEIMELRNALTASEVEVEEGLVREGNLRMQLEIQTMKRQQVESTMAAAEALVSSLREMITMESENGHREVTTQEKPVSPIQQKSLSPVRRYQRNPFTLRKETGSLDEISASKLDQVLSTISDDGNGLERGGTEGTTNGQKGAAPETAADAGTASEIVEESNRHEGNGLTGDTAPVRAPDVIEQRPLSASHSPLRSHSHPGASAHPPSPGHRFSLSQSATANSQLASSAETSSLLKSAFEPTPTPTVHQQAAIRSAGVYPDAPLPSEVALIAKSTGATVQRPMLPSSIAFTVSDAHSGDVYALASSRDGNWTVSGGDDKTIRVYDRDGKPCATILDSTRSVTALGIHPDSGGQNSDALVIYSGGSDGSVRAFRRQARRRSKWSLTSVLPVHAQAVRKILVTDKSGINAASNLILTCSTDRTIRMCDVEHSRRPFSVTSPSAVLDVASFEANGVGLIVSGHKDGGLRLWSSRDGNALVGAAKLHTKGVVSVSCLSDGHGVISLGRDNVLRLSDVRMNIAVVREMEGGVQTVSDWHRAAVQGRHAACGTGKPGNLCVWNVDSGKLVRRLSSQASEPDADVLDMVARKLRNPGCVLVPLWTPSEHFVCAHRTRQVAFWSCS